MSLVSGKGNHRHKNISCGQLYFLDFVHTNFYVYISMQTHPDVI